MRLCTIYGSFDPPSLPSEFLSTSINRALVGPARIMTVRRVLSMLRIFKGFICPVQLDLDVVSFTFPSSNYITSYFTSMSIQKAVPVPATSPLIASKASSANSLLKPSLLLSLSLLSHSLRPLLFSLCFSSIWSCNFFFCSSSSANRFLAAGSNKLGNASPPGIIAGTEAR